MLPEFMVIGVENSSVSNLIVQNIHTLSHISSKYYPLVTAQEQYPPIWDLTE